MTSVCCIDGCERKRVSRRGWCHTHYEHWRLYGEPISRRPTLEERFWDKVNKDAPSGCWEWTVATVYGYGRFGIAGRAMSAHRVAYELLVGPIPEGLQLDHLCRNPACVNPGHLEPVTGRENVLRGDTFAARQAAITHCPAGHEYDEANTRVDAKRCRHCRACQRERAREIRAKKLSGKSPAAA